MRLSVDLSPGPDHTAFAVVEANGVGPLRIHTKLPTGSMRQIDIWVRLWSRTQVVDRGYDTPCHEWTGPDSGKGKGGGYGRISLNGGTCAVHLVAWTNKHGYIPPRKQIDHKCNNRRCWNDEHLQLTSHKQNQRLRAARRKVP